MREIEEYNAKKIKYILLNGQLEYKKIELEYKNIKSTIEISSRTKYKKTTKFDDREMDMYYFVKNYESKEDTCFEINGKREQLFINIGEWGVNGSYNYRIQHMHISLGVNTNKFGSAKKFFSQLEISQFLEDSKFIYVVKNIKDLSGKGAISRINNGLKNRDKKYERRDRLVKRLNSDIILYDSKNWMVINKINKDDLNNKNKHNDIYYELIKDIINYSFTIEDIIAEDKLLINK